MRSKQMEERSCSRLEATRRRLPRASSTRREISLAFTSSRRDQLECSDWSDARCICSGIRIRSHAKPYESRVEQGSCTSRNARGARPDRKRKQNRRDQALSTDVRHGSQGFKGRGRSACPENASSLKYGI